MIGDKTTFEIKADDNWANDRHLIHSPTATAIRNHFNTPHAAFSGTFTKEDLKDKYQSPAYAMALMGNEFVCWMVEGYVSGEDCTVVLTETERRECTPEKREIYLKTEAEYKQ